MAWIQTTTPNLEIKGLPGVCLGMQQRVWGAPGLYNTAWQAWQATEFKHEDRNFPEDVAVPIWFDHWGAYGNPGQEVYGQYGHVATYVPGRGVLSNPGRGLGQIWYPTIDACAKDCNATYVGWSEDINTVRAVQQTQLTIIENKGNDMIVKVQCTDGFSAIWNMNTNAYQHIDDAAEWKYFGEILETVYFESEAHMNTIRKKYAKVFGG